MSKIYLSALLFLNLGVSLKAQVELKVYHGASGETQVYDNSDKLINKPIIRMTQGEVFTVKVINPNPILYNYTLKYETVTVESDDKTITDLFTQFNKIILSRPPSSSGQLTSATDDYKTAINTLVGDINTAKNDIDSSDKPELPDEALKYMRTGGFRLALDKINSISRDKFHLNSPSLLTDLNTLSDKASVDDIERQAFKLLNSSLVEKANEIKNETNFQSTETIWQKDFKVSDSAQKVSIVITKKDKSNMSLKRDGNKDKGFELVVATIVPYFRRSVVELIPVANFIFSRNFREFYLDNNVVQTRMKAKTTTSASVVLNVNFARFGEEKEMAIGIGPGYKFNSLGDAFESFYLSTLFSYKNFLRIGLGVGFAQLPADQLKDGTMIGQPLPANISILSDVIQYQETPSVFLTLSFTGLSLTQKK